MLYCALTFNNKGAEIQSVYTESLQEATDYVNRTLAKLPKGFSIGIWDMDEFGNFDFSESSAVVYHKK
jgi:hypothetical protein